jgi:monooxygenase
MEHLDVAVIGAGLSGVGAGSYLEQRCPWAKYAIFEARDAIGGTWDLFRYPGIRSDSDMFTLGYSFRPWDRDETIADGASILSYIRETASATGADRRIRFNHRVVRAEWSSEEARWGLEVLRTDTGHTFQVTCGFLFGCTGYYRYDHGYLPEFVDMDRFQGTIVHPQAWPADLDYAGKSVVVIGSGATAVTLVPALARTAGHVTMLQRSPTYIGSIPSKGVVDAALRKVLPRPVAAQVTRWLHALVMQGFYQLSRRRPRMVKKLLRAGLERELPRGYDIDKNFTPRYEPWDERFCVAPDGDLFGAIRSGSASVVTDKVQRFTEHGLLLESGETLDADVVVSATGLELLFLGGVELVVDRKPVDLTEKLVYKGAMLEDVPNLAIGVGYTNASWTLKCDLTCDFVCRLLDYMREHGYANCTPVNTEASVVSEPLLGLSSGYVLRSAHKFPRQGSRFPWRVHQSYLRDFRALKHRPVADRDLVFSAPPAGSATVWGRIAPRDETEREPALRSSA